MIRVRASAIKVGSDKATLRLYTNVQEAMTYLWKHIETAPRISACTIFTYGINVGIYKPEVGRPVFSTKNSCLQVMRVLCEHKIPTKIFVGETGSERTLERIQDIERYFGNVKCILYKGHHKLMYLSDGWGYVGSCNFTDSSLGDIIIAGNLSEIGDKSQWQLAINSITPH